MLKSSRPYSSIQDVNISTADDLLPDKQVHDKEEEDSDKNEQSQIPIDRGYAWCVVLGCFIMNFLFVGTFKSVGILFVEILEEFNASPSLVAWMIALYGGMWAMVAPFASGFSKRFTNRVVVMTGGFLCGLGFIIAAFSPTIIIVIIFYGFVAGVGIGLVYGPSLVMVALYFDKRRAIANGIAVAGGAVGSLIFPPFLRLLLDTYGYQSALFILGAIMWNILVSGALYTPLSFYTERKLKKKKVPTATLR